jgi:hypothetical protein
VVQVGDYLYNEDQDTDEFTQAVEVTYIILRPWEQLPETARGYTLKKATRLLQARVQGGRDLASPSFDEASALSDLEDADSEAADYNIFNNYAAYKIIRRTGSGNLLW